MCIYTHVLAGAAAATFTSNPWLGLVYGVASHGLLDLLPHYDFQRTRLEILLGLVALAGVLLVGGVSGVLLLGALGGVAPDLENLAWKLGWLAEERKVFPTHTGLLPHGRVIGPGSLWVQTALGLGCLGLVLWRGGP
jgi:hypothetical protein